MTALDPIIEAGQRALARYVAAASMGGGI